MIFVPLRVNLPARMTTHQVSTRRDDLAYILPMAVFLAFVQLGVWWPNFYPVFYITKTLLVAGLLVYFWKHFTQIRWTHLPLGFAVGVLGIVQWVGMEKLLLAYGPSWTHMSGEPLNPFELVRNPALAWSFVLFRWAGAFLVVPVMEELFWRDYVWRTIAAPNDFKLAEVGEWDPRAFFIVPAVFAAVHIQWLTAVVWALMIGILLVRTKSLGACVVAHATTNLLLGAYVLWRHDWYFW
jgi:CAAX prenyl protease-like protein